MNYLKKNTEFKILKINPSVVAAIHIAGVRGDPCGAVQRTAPQGSPRSTFMYFNIEINIID